MALLSSFDSSILRSLLVPIVIYVAYYYYKYLTRLNPLPGPFPLPFIGNLHQFIYYDYANFIKKCYEKYGDLFEIYVNGDRQICIGKLEVFDQLFNASTKSIYKLRITRKPGLEEFGVSGFGVAFNHDHESWHFNRHYFIQAMSIPSFPQETLEKAQKYLKETTNYWNDFADNNVEFDLKRWIYCHTADNSLDLYLGTNGYAMAKYHSDLTGKKANIPDKDRNFIDCLKQYGEGYIFHLFLGSFAKYIPFVNRIAKDHMDNRDKYWNMLRNVVRERKKFINNTPKDQIKNDMMNLFLTVNTEQDINASKNRIKDLSPEYQRPMSEKETFINLSEAIAGGADSTAGITAFTAYFLAKNPKVVTKIRAEVEAILGKDPRPINLEDLDKFKYVEAVIKETARMSSTTPLLDRYNDAPDEVAGYHWPVNTHFIINSFGPHYDKKYWVNPEKFDPERFLDGSSSNNLKALVLFGGGVRICPGRKIAMIGTKVLTAMLAYQFDYELVNDKPIRVRYAALNQPIEIPFRVKRRVF